jgi:hypothetical protein
LPAWTTTIALSASVWGAAACAPIAKAQRTTVAEINEVIDCWAASVIDEEIRKNALALELARLDEPQEVFCARAVPWPPRLSSAAA